MKVLTEVREGRAAMTYERLATDLPEPPDPFTIEQSYDADWAIDRRDLINWVKEMGSRYRAATGRTRASTRTSCEGRE